MDNVPDFEDVFANARRTSQQVQDILDRFLKSADEVEAEVTSISGGTSQVDQAFSELLG
jgi:hypothetical protein